MSRPDTGPESNPVRVWTEDLILPTYLPALPDRNPMFLEKRVYQGSSGRVYPLPFTDRIAAEPTPRRWKGVWIENEFLRALVLPEIGGRIHALQDKINGYDLLYHQPVIKPALVGLAGPWISGGIEFNWPQHHRPATFLPVDIHIEEDADGSKTLWCGDHDPMERMKAMHGLRLRPGIARLELEVRVHNRTPYVQTFLWWANVATRVHEAYRSFFPPDVAHVADHARRATSEFPLARGRYYGVDYGRRARRGVPSEERPARYRPRSSREDAPLSPTAAPLDRLAAAGPELPDYAPNDLSYYANIPVPTSYMCLGSKDGFFGGYDYAAQAGLVHVADPHLSPGKKQWTWGNHEFGYAWDRNLTDPTPDGEYPPYIELMAGVYTDNQPDFSFLQPGETKGWRQHWYPIRKIGPVRQANTRAALALDLLDQAAVAARSIHVPGRPANRRTRALRIGVVVTRRVPEARITLSHDDRPVATWTTDLDPTDPAVFFRWLPPASDPARTEVRIDRANGELLIRSPVSSPDPLPGEKPQPATEPPDPKDVPGTDELYLTGLHLEQYRHATRCPSLYWREALRRDPGDSRCRTALGRWHLRRGEFETAETHLRLAIERVTRRNPNPYDGEPFYQLGLCLRFLGRDDEAYAALSKAAWNQAWIPAALTAVAEIDAGRRDWQAAEEHLVRALHADGRLARARNLLVLVLRRLGRREQADTLLRETRTDDPLDWWARHLDGHPLDCDSQTRLDLAHDYARAGFLREALDVLEAPTPAPGDLLDRGWGATPMIAYTRGWLFARLADRTAADREFRRAAAESPDYCFPARLEEILVLRAAMEARPRDPRAPYYLGNLLYDRRRHDEAIALWERAARLDPRFPTVQRNLGIGYFNIRRQPARAEAAYHRAVRLDPGDARLLYERDQLWKRLGRPTSRRLAALERHPDLVRRRDDLVIELGGLYHQAGRPEAAAALLRERRFQPWEGGEGQALALHTRTQLALGRRALARGDGTAARTAFERALMVPENLGEARHLLANDSDIHYWIGRACQLQGDRRAARRHWTRAARFQGDFQEMSVRAFSEMTYYSALSWACLGREERAARLLRDLLDHARRLRRSPARIDYFATSLPSMLLFDDDLAYRRETTALFLEAQARLGLGPRPRALLLLRRVLHREPHHALAADLLADPPSPLSL